MPAYPETLAACQPKAGVTANRMSSETGITDNILWDIPVVLTQLSHVMVSFSAGTVTVRGNGVALSTMAFGGQVTKWKITEGSPGLQVWAYNRPVLQIFQQVVAIAWLVLLWGQGTVSVLFAVTLLLEGEMKWQGHSKTAVDL